jgi:hypothetical protein
MNGTSSQDLFRQAAEAEDGMPSSAGARVAHVRAAVQSGRALYVDLSAIPDDKRGPVVAQITELVKRASASATQPQSPAPSEPSRGEN